MKRRAWFAQLKPLLWLTIVTSAFLIEQSTYTLDIIVTSESNSGAGTLRQAILDLNSGGGGTAPNTITFTNSVKTINLTSPLPSIDNPVTIDGFAVTGVDCDQLSPVDDPEQFSATITVTIDGRQIPTIGSTDLNGLLISTDDIIIRGLRVTNFTNIEDARVLGIATDGNNTLIECCEVINLNGNTPTLSRAITGIKGKNDTIISKCFVHNLNSLNRTAINSTTRSGRVIGISQIDTIRNCRIECLKSGDIIYTSPGSNGILTLDSGLVSGISSGGFGGEALIENCVVNHCQSGSILAAESADVFIGSTSGMSFNARNPEINNCTVCNINGGNATLTNKTFNLQVNKINGISISFADNTSVQNNTIHNIHRGAVELEGLKSFATLENVTGVFISGVTTIIIENTSVSNVTCQKVIASGECTTIQDTDSLTSLGCLANLATSFMFSSPICTGMFFDGETVQICNNTVTSINTGKRLASGDQALINSGYAAGIWANASQEITAEDNTVQDIFGAELVAGPAARGIFGGTGCKGIALWSLFISGDIFITAERNKVERVCEQSLRAASDVPGGYIFIEDLLGLTKVLKPAAQTTGISIKTFVNSFTLLKIQVSDNTVNDVIGSKVTGNNSPTGTMAVGINIEPSTILDGSATCAQLTDMAIGSTVQENAINNILSGTNNSAYGILLDNTITTLISLEAVSISPLPALFNIQNNTITSVAGLGTPQSFEAPLLSLEGCGTVDLDSITFVPFPYQPTSGIYTLFANCSTISGNTISNVTEPNKNARGITTQASSDMEISYNTISKVNGYGIFVGGALAGLEFINSISGLFTEEQFENLFASTRNKIFSNSTFDNTKQGIELGLIDWNGYFQVSESQCGGPSPFARTNQEIPEDSVAVFGNHGQVKPRILTAKCRRDGTITIDFLLDSPEQPFTKFEIQFFTNSSNSVPHGEHHINELDDPRFTFQTNINGRASGSITFTLLAQVNNGDIISAHVTVVTIGQSTSVDSKYKGDTSEFAVESDNSPCPTFLTPRPSAHNQKPGFASILGR